MLGSILGGVIGLLGIGELPHCPFLPQVLPCLMCTRWRNPDFLMVHAGLLLWMGLVNGWWLRLVKCCFKMLCTPTRAPNCIDYKHMLYALPGNWVPSKIVPPMHCLSCPLCRPLGELQRGCAPC